MSPDRSTDGGADVGPARLSANVALVRDGLAAANAAREAALPDCRRVIQLAGSAIKAVHRLEPERAASTTDEAEAVLRRAQAALAGHPAIEHAGFLHDAEKEYVEARCVIALVAGTPLPSADDLGVGGPAYLRGLAEAASELRRHLLDRLRDGDLARGEELLGTMDDVYEALVGIDFPDAVTGGLRRTLDALRAVLERSRGDLTTTVLQSRLQAALETVASQLGGSAGD
jgi:translin